jgi:hypothetical protein
MSAPTPKAEISWRQLNVRFGSKADMCSAKGHVRFTPESGHSQSEFQCPLSANSGCEKDLAWCVANPGERSGNLKAAFLIIF